MAPQLSAKRLELLGATVPGLSRVAVLLGIDFGGNMPTRMELQRAAQVLGLELQLLQLHDADGIESAFDVATMDHAEALFVLNSPLTLSRPQRIADLAAQRRLPAMYARREFVAAGGLMAYGPNGAGQHRRAAYYVDRILKGAKPADLPVEQPMTFDLVVNMKTAQALGITFPNEIMLQVTEVIQ
jgi:putative ABC transport system substrate-binding protein